MSTASKGTHWHVIAWPCKASTVPQCAAMHSDGGWVVLERLGWLGWKSEAHRCAGAAGDGLHAQR